MKFVDASPPVLAFNNPSLRNTGPPCCHKYVDVVLTTSTLDLLVGCCIHSKITKKQSSLLFVLAPRSHGAQYLNWSRTYDG